MDNIACPTASLLLPSADTPGLAVKTRPPGPDGLSRAGSRHDPAIPGCAAARGPHSAAAALARDVRSARHRDARHRPAPPPPRRTPRRALIARAVPGGARRTRSPREWLREVQAVIEAAGWYANRVDHFTAVVHIYAFYMDWDDRTTRPTHARVADRCGVSERTVKRVVAWLHEQKFMGTVTPGMIPRYRPGRALALDPGNEAAEYVLTIPCQRKRQLPAADAGTAEFGPPSMSRQGHSKGPRTRETVPGAGTPWCLADRPQNRTDREAAAEAMRQRCAPLARLSTWHVAAIARPWLAAGWTPADVLHALDWRPPHQGGRRWRITAGIAAPGAWANWRLAHWRVDGVIAAPASYHAAEADARRRAAQAERRAATAAAAAAALPGNAQARAAAAARGRLAAASSRAAATIAQQHPAPARFRRAATGPGDATSRDIPARPDIATQEPAPGVPATEPPGDGPALARALLAVTSPAERDAIIRAWRDRRRTLPGGPC